MELIEVLGRIGFDWRMALANVVNFLIVFWLLKKFVWAPMRLRIEERQREINKGLDDASKAEQALSAAKEKSQLLIEEAKRERHSLLENAKGTAEQIVSNANHESVVSTRKILEGAEKRAVEIENSAMNRVRKDSVEFVISAARAVLQDQIDEKRGEAVIHNLLKRNEA